MGIIKKTKKNHANKVVETGEFSYTIGGNVNDIAIKTTWEILKK